VCVCLAQGKTFTPGRFLIGDAGVHRLPWQFCEFSSFAINYYFQEVSANKQGLLHLMLLSCWELHSALQNPRGN